MSALERTLKEHLVSCRTTYFNNDVYIFSSGMLYASISEKCLTLPTSPDVYKHVALSRDRPEFVRAIAEIRRFIVLINFMTHVTDLINNRVNYSWQSHAEL